MPDLEVSLKTPLGQLCKRLYPDYRGRRPIRVRAAEKVHVSDYWDGGSRTYVTFAALDGSRAYTSDELMKPEHRQKAGNWFNLPIGDVPLIPGVIAVEHCIFCGKDLGLRVIVHPADMPKLLTA